MNQAQLVNSFIEQNTHESWFDLLSNLDSLQQSILNIVSLSKTTSIEPKLPDLLACFEHCSLDNLKVIILGQDCYPQHGVATGLAFANKDKIVSPSLRIIAEELMRTHGVLSDPSLISWANQGVLLLNTSLTIETDKISSHYKIWEEFMIDFIKELSKQPYLWVLMGSRAQSFKHCINTGEIIKSVHPAFDTYGNERRFRGSGIFKQIDEKLTNKNFIKWV